MTDSAKRGRRNRQRGQEGEREVCAILRDHLGIDVRRRLGQERDSGTDIHLGPYRIEVKRRKRLAGLYEWMEQATYGDSLPVAAVRADGQEWLCVLRLSDFVRLAREDICEGEADMRELQASSAG